MDFVPLRRTAGLSGGRRCRLLFRLLVLPFNPRPRRGQGKSLVHGPWCCSCGLLLAAGVTAVVVLSSFHFFAPRSARATRDFHARENIMVLWEKKKVQNVTLELWWSFFILDQTGNSALRQVRRLEDCTKRDTAVVGVFFRVCEMRSLGSGILQYQASLKFPVESAAGYAGRT